jgi:signal transduction histidine kinase
VTADPNLTESLIANLLDNAIRHNLPGGQAEISTALTTAGAFVSVSNTGPRIPPDAVEDLFQPFRQFGVQRTRHGEGYGLGLAIVRAIADAHGAVLTVRARPAGGLDVKVTFPRQQLPSQPAQASELRLRPPWLPGSYQRGTREILPSQYR